MDRFFQKQQCQRHWLDRAQIGVCANGRLGRAGDQMYEVRGIMLLLHNLGWGKGGTTEGIKPTCNDIHYYIKSKTINGMFAIIMRWNQGIIKQLNHTVLISMLVSFPGRSTQSDNKLTAYINHYSSSSLKCNRMQTNSIYTHVDSGSSRLLECTCVWTVFS